MTLKVRATFLTLSFEMKPGLWTNPLPYWFFEEDKDGKLWLKRPTTAPKNEFGSKES